MIKKCLACNNPLSVYGDNIYFCSFCGLGQTANKPKVEYTYYHRDREYFNRSKQFANIFAKRVEIIKWFKKDGRVLEIGSSTGEMLTQFKDWEVLGIEPSQTAVQIARSRKINTLHTTFEKAELPKNYFDVIIMNHVLEHVADPIQVVNKIYTILKLGGIVLIDVPNFGSLSSKLMKSKWPYLLTNEHNWHFTKESLEFLLQKNGFKLVYWETRSGIWDYGYPWLELWQSLSTFKKRFFINILTFVPNWIIGNLGYGTSLSIVAQK